MLNDNDTVTVENCCKRTEGNHCTQGKAKLSEPDHLPLEGKFNVSFNNKRNYLNQKFIK